MKNINLINRIERWFVIVSPIITLILLVILYNLIADKSIFNTIINAIAPFLFSFLIAWLLNPMVVKLCSLLQIKRWVATLIVFIGILAMISLIFIWVIPQLISQFAFLSEDLPVIASDINDSVEKIIENNHFNFSADYLTKISNQISDAFVKTFSDGLKLFSSSVEFVGGVVSTIFMGVMALMAGIYILIDFNKFSSGLDKIIPSRMKDDFNFLKKEINRVVIGYLRGLIIETLLVGLLAFCAFKVLSIEGALVFAVIIGITNIIPYLGPYIGAIPVTLFALTTSPKLMIIIIVIIIVIQQIDGIIIKPKVFGKTTDVHPSISIISIILFGRIFGFIGIVFAIPIAGFTIIIIKFVYSKLLKKYPEILR
ncbi:MAG: AI-2E family transporter [Bacilli bacterium]